jgi:hypothetical protein
MAMTARMLKMARAIKVSSSVKAGLRKGKNGVGPRITGRTILSVPRPCQENNVRQIRLIDQAADLEDFIRGNSKPI